MKPEVKIQNVVASVTLNQKINLERLVNVLDNAEFHPDKFPGIIYKLKDPKCSVLIFNSGKLVCSGNNTIDNVEVAVKNVINEIKKSGIVIITKPEITVQNMVASGTMKGYIDLFNSTMILDDAIYEPEQFPGLIYHIEDPKVAILLFASGKIVITGAKSEDDINNTVDHLYRKLNDEGLIFYD